MDTPFALLCIKLGPNYNRVECTVLLDTNYFIDMIKIIAEILIVRVIVGPVPGLVHFRPREFVLRDLGVDAGPRVAVPSPGATGIVTGLKNNRLQAAIPKSLEHKDAGYPVSLYTTRTCHCNLPKPAPTTKASTSRFSAYGPVLSLWLSE